jgi:predicted GNAT superfamily acetyltransferase
VDPEVAVREARERADYDACVELQREVWGMSDLDVTSALQLVATVHAGGLLLVAEAAGNGLVGFAYAFAAWKDGVPHLHSDLLAVRPAWRGRGLGRRLKWAQREAALARGLGLVTWTFDPMRAANARLNLRHLGAFARELLPDFYGRTSSALHHGLATDRLLVRWELASPRVRRIAAGRSAPPARDALAAAPPINDVRLRGGLPESSDPRLDLDARRLWLRVPADWDAVCRGDLGLAREWQALVRRSLLACFARGYAAVDAARLPGDGPSACYLLERLSRPRSRPAAPGRRTTRSTSRRRAARAARRAAAPAGRGRR